MVTKFFSNFRHKIELLIKYTSIPGSFYNPVRLHQIIFIISNCIIVVARSKQL